MNFKKGEVLFFNKPFGWTSFKVVGQSSSQATVWQFIDRKALYG